MSSLQALDAIPHAVQTLQRIAAAMGRLGADRFYRFPLLSAPVAAGGNPSAPSTIRFATDGYVIALYGTTLGATAAEAAGCEVQIQMSGEESLTTDGDNPEFSTYRSLFGDAQNWTPCVKRVYQGQIWTATWRNFSPGPVEPRLELAFIEAPHQ